MHHQYCAQVIIMKGLCVCEKKYTQPDFDKQILQKSVKNTHTHTNISLYLCPEPLRKVFFPSLKRKWECACLFVRNHRSQFYAVNTLVLPSAECLLFTSGPTEIAEKNYISPRRAATALHKGRRRRMCLLVISSTCTTPLPYISTSPFILNLDRFVRSFLLFHSV